MSAIDHVPFTVAHVCCALAMFLLLKTIWQANWPALAGAALFAVHPVQVAGMAAGSRLPVACACALLALVGYIRHIRAQQRDLAWLLCAIVLAEFAVLLSPGMASIAAIAWVLDYVGYARPFRSALRDSACVAVPTMLTAAVVYCSQHTLPWLTVPFWLRPILPLDTCAAQLTRLILPTHWAARPPHVVAVYFIWWTWLLPAAIGTLLWLYKVGHAYLIAAASVFAIAIFPWAGWIPYANQAVSTASDHHLYLAMLAPALALSGWLNRPRPAAVTALFAVCLTAAAMLSLHRLQLAHFALIPG